MNYKLGDQLECIKSFTAVRDWPLVNIQIYEAHLFTVIEVLDNYLVIGDYIKIHLDIINLHFKLHKQMKTKVIMLGEDQAKDLKPITFLHQITPSVTCITAQTVPEKFKFVELIAFNYADYTANLDLMFAYNDNRHEGILFLGYFNDGVVE